MVALGRDLEEVGGGTQAHLREEDSGREPPSGIEAGGDGAVHRSGRAWLAL